MYLILVALGFCFVYIFLLFLYALFFNNTFPALRLRFVYSVIWILLLYTVVSLSAGNIENLEFSNRVLHVFAGGFLAFFVCFLVVKDLKLRMSRFHFIVFSLLVVSALGVANEVIEYFLQNYTSLSFATSANDTWMDLMSNSLGAFIATVIFTPFIKTSNN